MTGRLRGEGGRRQPGCAVLHDELYGVGTLVAAIIWAFLGDPRRFSTASQAVRFAGLDITVRSSDAKGPPGKLSGQGPPILGWALFEAGHHASRAASPDHDYYARVAARIDANRPPCPSPASSPAAPATSCAASATRPGHPPPQARNQHPTAGRSGSS
jgi:hypothetical protein